MLHGSHGTNFASGPRIKKTCEYFGDGGLAERSDHGSIRPSGIIGLVAASWSLPIFEKTIEISGSSTLYKFGKSKFQQLVQHAESIGR